MAQLVRVLMVDDHPFIIEAYKNAIKGYNTKGLYEFDITQTCNTTTAHTSTTATQLTHNSNIAEKFQESRILKSCNKNVRCRDTLEEDVYYFFGPLLDFLIG